MPSYMPRELFDQGEDALWSQEADGMIAAAGESLAWEQQAGEMLRGVGEQLGAIFNPRPVPAPMMAPADRQDRVTNYRPQQSTLPTADELFRTIAPEWAEQEPVVQEQPVRPGLVPPGTQTAGAGVPSPQAPAVAAVERGGDLRAYARQAAQRAGVDPDIFERQIQQENGFKVSGGSPAGAQGIAQIVPKFHPGVDVNDPYASLDYAVNLMKSHLGTYGGDYEKSLAAYNAGPGNVASGAYKGFAETQTYLKNILGGAGEAVGKAVQGAGQALGQLTQDPGKNDILGSARQELGKPYGGPLGGDPNVDRWGQVGWDCSSFVSGVFKRFGVTLTPFTDRIAAETRQIDAQNARPGDIVMFSYADPSQPGVEYPHTAIYAGDGKIIDASYGRGVTERPMPTGLGTPEFHRPDGVTGADSRGVAATADVVNEATPNIPDKGSDLPGTQALNPWDLGKVGETLGRTWDAAGQMVGDAASAVTETIGGASRAAVSGLNQVADDIGGQFTPRTEPTNPSFETDEETPLASVVKPGGALPQAVRPWAPIWQLADTDRQILDAEDAGDQPTADQLRGQQDKIMENMAIAGTMPMQNLGGKPGLILPGGARPSGEPLLGANGQPIPGAKPITLTTQQEISRLRLDKFPEEARDDILKAATDVNFGRDQRRGVLPDAVVAEMAEDLSRRGDAWLGARRPGRAYNPEETLALRNLVTTQAIKVRELSGEIGASRAAGTTPDLLIAQRAAEAGKLAGYVKLAEGVRAEAGRTLRQYAQDARLIEADPNQAIARIYKVLGGRDNAIEKVDEYTKLVESGADPFQMAHFWAKVEKPAPTFADWFTAVRYNSMLSGPRTFEINAIGGLTEAPHRLIRDFGASTARGRPEELAYELTGAWVGAQKGATAFVETLRHGLTSEQAARGDLPRSLASRIENPVGRGVATALEAPGRVMQATDELIRQTAFGMGLYRDAAVMASKEGLRGDAWSRRIAELVENPSEQKIKDALGIADRMTFHNDMGALGSALTGVQKVPYLGNILVPFLKTVYNITARGIDRSPLGIVGTGIDVARGAYKNGAVPKGAAPLGERLGDNAMGAIAGLYLVGQGMQGNITASGPDDPEKRQLLQAQGWQPYSVKIGDKWISYSNWGPLSVPFALAAGLSEANLYAKPDASVAEKGLETFRRFGELSTEQTYLSGVGAFYKAVKEPDVYGSTWFSQFLQTLVPYGAAINTAGQATDPLSRRPEKYDVGQALKGRFPGLREQVPANQDVLGRPVPNQYAGAAAVQPLRISQQRQDPVLEAFQAAGVDIGKPPDQLSLGKGVNIPLSPAEQREWQVIRGDALQQATQKMMGDPRWDGMKPEQRALVLEHVLDAARTSATGQMARAFGAEELRRRVKAG